MCLTYSEDQGERESIQLQNHQTALKAGLTQLLKHKNTITNQVYTKGTATISFPGLNQVELWIEKVVIIENYVNGLLHQSNKEIQKLKFRRSKRRDYSIYQDLSRLVTSANSEVDQLWQEQPSLDDIVLQQRQEKERQQQLQMAQAARIIESSKSLVYNQSTMRSASFGIAYGYSRSAFTLDELKAATDNFNEGNILGEGGYGTIYMGILPNKKVVAVKRHRKGVGERFENKFFVEIEAISRIHHRNIVTLVGYCFTDTEKILVYEYVSNNNLAFHLHGEGRATMDWATRRKIAIGCAKGLAYLHEDCKPAIIHRDIKANNILLDDDFEAKVADFGLVKYFLGTKGYVSTGVAGTFGYMDHEYASTGRVTIKSDVYSFGVVLLELITGRPHVDPHLTYPHSSLVAWARPLLREALKRGEYVDLADPKLQNSYDKNEMADMITCAAACVRRSAEDRPKTGQIVRILDGAVPALPDLSSELETTEEMLEFSHEIGTNGTNYYSLSKSSYVQKNIQAAS